MKLYQFSGIPYILVLDQEGRIVGKNLRDKALMDKLEEMVKRQKEGERGHAGDGNVILGKFDTLYGVSDYLH